MATNRYSLAEYTVSIGKYVVNATGVEETKNLITIGGYGDNGEGSFLGQIKISRDEDLWKTTGDATGSWVHSRSYNKTGKVEISINQVSDQTIELIQLASSYEEPASSTESGLIITVSKGNSTYAECRDCYPVKIPDQVFSDEAERQDWSFTCGQVLFPVTSKK